MDILVLFLIIAVAFITASRFENSLPSSQKGSAWGLLLIHSLTAVGYYLFIMRSGGDAYRYWNAGRSLDWNSALTLLFDSKGTYFMEAFNYFFSGFLRLGFFVNTCVYAFLGYCGIIYFYRVILAVIPSNSKFMGLKLFPLIFYLPMLHFWASGIGKDTLLFWAIGMFAYGLLNIPKRFLLIAFGVAFAYLVRPHVALLLVAAFGLAFLWDNRTAVWKRIVMGAIMLAGAVVMLPTVLEYVKLEEVSVESITDYSERRADGLSRSHTGSSVDISSYPPPLKWFTFLFRPLFFDVNGIPALVASFENLFLLLLFFKVLGNKPILAFRRAPFVIKGLTLFLILGTVLMSGALGNLGIMIRMRNMFLPGMMIYFLWVLSYAQVRK